MIETISIIDDGRRWVVRHNDGVLGFASSQGEALAIGRSLLAWLDEAGRPGELIMGELIMGELATDGSTRAAAAA